MASRSVEPVTGRGLTHVRALATAAALAAALTSGGACGGRDDEAASSAASPSPDAPPAAVFVGRAVCAGCHAMQDSLWTGSHHDLAMAEAEGDAVLGDFDDATFTHRGITTTFFTRDGRPRVRTAGPDGEPGEYEISYTFGWAPLQQYLVAVGDGRLQVLGTAWDSRPAGEGGQRWFQLHPDADTGPGSPLHWTAPGQTWNAACADCHSTGLRKGFDLAAGSYETTWEEIDVSCEACHGPGSVHVSRAEAQAAAAVSDEGAGAGAGEGRRRPRAGPGGPAGRWGLVDLARPPGAWTLPPGAATAVRNGRLSRAEVETCAPCHSRRSALAEPPVPGRPLLDAYRPSLLREDLYHPDGQILDEVYVYGSFLQSRMYAAGVTCSDCHEPHSLTLRAEGNALCTRCHRSETYDAPAHHFHEPGSTGARCVECHMPATTYMEVDPRRDHGLRIPRPDLAAGLGTPDACTSCHEGQPAEWAAAAVEGWHGPAGDRLPHFAEAFAAGRAGNPEAWPDLLAIAADPARPGIVRATAFSLLGGYPRPAPADAVRRGLTDGDPLVRLAGLELVGASGVGPTAPSGGPLGTDAVVALAAHLLEDSLRAVRVEAARVLAAVPPRLLTAEQTRVFERAAAEYEQAQLVNADHPASWVNVGDLRARRGRTAQAEEAYRTALSLDPSHVAAHLNLADLQRALGRDDLAEQTLLLGLNGRRSDPPELLHALGLLRVRQGRLDEAVDLLARAAAARPDDARFAYVHGVAVVSARDTAGGIEILEGAVRRHPWDRDVLAALAAYHRDLGHAAAALGYAERLVEVVPEDEGARELLASLTREAGRAGR